MSAHRDTGRAHAVPGEGSYEALGRGARNTPPFLAPHHIETARRVEATFVRARLQPRVTHGWSAMPKGACGAGAASDLTDMAADARKQLAGLHAVLPSECAGVVFDVCGLGKGLQDVECERGWPRRSAKLVLRIGLDRLAEHFGLSPHARGGASGRVDGWVGLGGRPTEVG